MIATTRRSFRVVITTRMIETVSRLVVVMHMAHSHPWAILARDVPGTRLLVGSRFAGDKCVCWWEVILLVRRPFAGETAIRWWEVA